MHNFWYVLILVPLDWNVTYILWLANSDPEYKENADILQTPLFRKNSFSAFRADGHYTQIYPFFRDFRTWVVPTYMMGAPPPFPRDDSMLIKLSAEIMLYDDLVHKSYIF